MAVPCSVSECDRAATAKGYCLMHYKRVRKTGTPLAAVIDVDGQRVCTSCSESKPLEEFSRDARSSGGRLRRCKTCTVTYRGEWAKGSDARKSRRRGNVLRQYGPDGVVVLDRMLAGEGCDACGEVRPRMAIDHNHETGAVRGLLCSNCNTALGLLGEDYSRMIALIDYMLAAQPQETLEITHAQPR